MNQIIVTQSYTKHPNGLYELHGRWTLEQIKELIKKEENN